jgi:hypothetical protein
MKLVVDGFYSHIGSGKLVMLKTEEAEKLLETVNAKEPEKK